MLAIPLLENKLENKIKSSNCYVEISMLFVFVFIVHSPCSFFQKCLLYMRIEKNVYCILYKVAFIICSPEATGRVPEVGPEGHRQPGSNGGGTGRWAGSNN